MARAMRAPKRYRVRFVPVKDGDAVVFGDSLPPSGSYYASKAAHIFVGFKPGPGTKPNGWLVFLVDEAAKPKTARPHRTTGSAPAATEGNE